MKRATILIAGISAACAPVDESTRLPERGMSDRVWALQTLQGEPLFRRGSQVATVRFNPDRTITGTWACNDLGPGKPQWAGMPGEMHGTIDAQGTGAGIITVVGCGDTPAVATANRFWRLMDTARTWSVNRGSLSITFADGSTAHLIPARR